MLGYLVAIAGRVVFTGGDPPQSGDGLDLSGAVRAGRRGRSRMLAGPGTGNDLSARVPLSPGSLHDLRVCLHKSEIPDSAHTPPARSGKRTRAAFGAAAERPRRSQP